MARRVVSVVLLLLTFHLTLAAGDFLCAAHGVLAEPVAGSATGHEHHGTPASGDDAWGQTAQNGDECETPARAQCCEALASCTVTIAAARDSHAHSWNLGREAVPRSALLQATSVVTAPDPPPPKA